MPSDLNFCVLAGHLLDDPQDFTASQPDSLPTVIASIASEEEWVGRDGVKRARTNRIGILAHGNLARRLLDLPKGTHVTCHGKLQTTELTGPRGGTTTKTKIRITSLFDQA